MRKMIVGVVIGVCATTLFQSVMFSQSPAAAPPQLAFDITKADVDLLLKNAPPAVDQQIRVVDVGKYNLAVGIIHRTKTNDAPGAAASGPYHDDSAEVYIIQSGSGVLTTGASLRA